MNYSFFVRIFCIALACFIGWISPLHGKESAALKGRILDTQGQAVQGAEVYAYRSNKVKGPADYISNRTGADGIFTLVLPPGKYWVLGVFRKSGAKFGPLITGDKHSGEPIPMNVKAGQETERNFTVMDLREAARQIDKKSEELFKITGKILDKHGQPLPMAYAMAHLQPQLGTIPRYLSRWTDDTGRYILYVPRGTLFLGAALTFPVKNDYFLKNRIDVQGDMQEMDIIVMLEKK